MKGWGRRVGRRGTLPATVAIASALASTAFLALVAGPVALIGIPDFSTSRMNDFIELSCNRLWYIPFGCYRENQSIQLRGHLLQPQQHPIHPQEVPVVPPATPARTRQDDVMQPDPQVSQQQTDRHGRFYIKGFGGLRPDDGQP